MVYFERLLTIRLDHVVSQNHVTNKNHYTTRVSMATNLPEWQTTLMGSYLQSHITLWSCGLARSQDKLKPLNLHYHSVYGHQTCNNGNIPWQTPNHKVIQSFDHVVLQGHVTNKSHFISITRVPMAYKLGRIMTVLDGLLPIMSHGTLISCPCETEGSLTGGGSASKYLSCHRLLVSCL